MARLAEFTDVQIIEAGRQLKQAGKRITGFGLRNAVGGGSANRLLEIWEHHEMSGAAGDDAQAELISELPMEVADQLNSVIHAFTSSFSERFTALAREMNHKAISASERRVKELTQAAENKTEQAKAEVADANTAVAKAEDDRDEFISKALALQAELDQVKAADQQKQFELKQLKKEHETLIKLSLQETEASKKTIEGLQDKESLLSKQLEKVRDDYAKVSGQLDEARNLSTEQKQTIKDLQAETSSQMRELGKLQGIVESRDAQVSELKSRILEHTADIKSAQAELKITQAELRSVQDQIRERDHKIIELTQSLEKTTKKV